MNKDESTEERIKEAAKRIFQEKGYGLTRTREIAEAAGINSALLNYYFRSKEKLFQIIMLESIRDMFSFMGSIINDRNTSLSFKIDATVNRYIDICLDNPNLPLFIVNEMSTDSDKIIKKSGIPQDLLTSSYLFIQLKDQLNKNNIAISQFHFVVNLISMSIMPAVSMPLISYLYDMDKQASVIFLEERRKWIPIWIKQILKIDE